MPYMGELRQAVAYNIAVDASGVADKKVAITIEKINRRDKVQAAETYSVDARANQTIPDTAGQRIDRVIISVHVPAGATAEVVVSQTNANGTVSTFRQTCAGDTDLVFDTVP